ncbi:MAG: ribonuclease HII [Panacagrimonas sp.]
MADFAVDRVAGVDEVGRGCLAGPVYAAAVILPAGDVIAGLDDSKKLTPDRRLALDACIRSQALAWAIGVASVAEIDALNILQASLLAMRRAVSALALSPSACWVDGNQNPRLDVPVRLIVGGDGLEPCIMAASVIAKVARDREMQRLDAEHPGYGFAQHKGYGTPEHLIALRVRGVSKVHRLSFAPCRSCAVAIPDSRLPIPV